MGYLRHLHACNRHDLSGFRRFMIGGEPVGWIRHALARRLAEERGVFAVHDDAVLLSPALSDYDARTEAVAGVIAKLVVEGVIARHRSENYAVVRRWLAPPLLEIDRAAVAYFGIKTFGLHVNGFVRRPDGIHLWVGRRNTDRRVAPGKLDNLVAGGLPAGLSLTENLVKEADEEAGLDAALALSAKPVGAITYAMETAAGLKPDTLFNFDLELDESVRPRNRDGEVAEFTLRPLDEVARLIRETDAFKFNVNHVNIDFMIRHGVLTPAEPEYPYLLIGLHPSLPE